MKNFQSLFDLLFKHPKVRYAAVIDSLGKRIAGEMKPGLRSITSVKTDKRIAVQSVIVLKMAESFESETGRLHYTAIRWDKIVMLYIFLTSDMVLNLSIEGTTPLREVFAIEKQVKKWKKEHLDSEDK